MAAAERNEAIETVDIMPTLAASIGLAVDPEVDRRRMLDWCSGR